MTDRPKGDTNNVGSAIRTVVFGCGVLELERKAEERHQYLDGYIFAMAGESPEHADYLEQSGRLG